MVLVTRHHGGASLPPLLTAPSRGNTHKKKNVAMKVLVIIFLICYSILIGLTFIYMFFFFITIIIINIIIISAVMS